MRANAVPKAGRRAWIGLGVLALPSMLYAMDLTVLNLAVPSLSADLAPSSSELLWIVDIYGFMVSGSLITMGALGDRIGRRRLLLIGAAAFGTASVLAAFSTSAAMLIGARALLGVAGATLAPSTLSLIRNMFLDPRERTIAIGVWVTSYSIGGAIGPLIGGLVLQYFWWGAVFLIGVPVMALLLVLGPILLPEFKDPEAGPLDLWSVALSLTAVLSAIYGLKRIAEDGVAWRPALAIAGGIAVALVFLRRQRSLPHPLIELQLFRVRAFSTSLAAHGLGCFVVLGVYVFIAQYLQLVRGLSPMGAGLVMVPSMASFIAATTVVPVIARRFRPAHVMSGGLLLAAVGFEVLARVDAGSGLAIVVIGSTVYSLGLSPVVMLATEQIVGNAPAERAGAASAISETGAELGGALGIAILGSIGVAAYRSAMAGGVPTGVPVDGMVIAKATLGGAVAVARHLPDALGGELLGNARDAFARAFALVARIGAVLAAAMAVISILVLRRRAPATEPGWVVDVAVDVVVRGQEGIDPCSRA